MGWQLITLLLMCAIFTAGCMPSDVYKAKNLGPLRPSLEEFRIVNASEIVVFLNLVNTGNENLTHPTADLRPITAATEGGEVIEAKVAYHGYRGSPDDPLRKSPYTRPDSLFNETEVIGPHEVRKLEIHVLYDHPVPATTWFYYSVSMGYYTSDPRQFAWVYSLPCFGANGERLRTNLGHDCEGIMAFGDH